MKRLLSILIILFLLVLPSTVTAIGCPPLPETGDGDWVFPGSMCENVLIVCEFSEFETINSAMAAAAAGDTIMVAEGTYTEAVVFTQDNITLKAYGSPENTTITQAAGTTVSFGTKSGCTVEGFTLTLSASASLNDEVIYSNNDSLTDYNTVKNCIITDTNAVASTFAMTMINVDDGGFKLLNNAMHITQTNEHAAYAIQNTAAHISHYIGNNLTITHADTTGHGSYGFHHAAATSTMYCMGNTIDVNSTHTGAGVAYIIYASAVENYVSSNEINAVTTGTGLLYVLYTGGTDTAWYTGNNIYATTADGDAEWANLTTGTTYATGNNISGNGASTTGGTVYESGNLINGVLSVGTILDSYALEAIVGTSLNADDLVNTGGVLELQPEIPHTDAIQTWTAVQTFADHTLTSKTSAPGSPVGGTWYRADDGTWDPAGLSLGYDYFVIYDDNATDYKANFDERGTLHLANTPIVASTNPTTDASNKIALDYSDAGQGPIFIEVYDEGVPDASTVVASNVICESFTIFEPDVKVAIEPNIPLKQFVAEGYPFGVTFISIHVGTDGTNVTNDSINFERWTTEDDGDPDTMENIDLTSVDNNEDDGTIANNPVADDYLVADITGWDDNIPLLIITICYKINPGD